MYTLTMPTKSTILSLEEMENLFANTLPIEQLIFLELRDCDQTVGTPLYAEKVETLVRTINSHQKAKDDKKYIGEIEESFNEINDPKAILHNSRCTTRNKIKIGTVKIIDYKKQNAAALNFLARRNITFKEERTAVL